MFSPKSSYIFRKGITFASRLYFHTFDGSRSGRQSVGVVFTCVPATHLIVFFCARLWGVVFISVPATRLIHGGGQTVRVVITSVPAILLNRCGRQTVGVVVTSVLGAPIEICC